MAIPMVSQTEIIILRAIITHHPLNTSTRTRIVNVVGKPLKRGESAKPRKKRGSTKLKRNVLLGKNVKRKSVKIGIVKKAKGENFIVQNYVGKFREITHLFFLSDLKPKRKGKYARRRNVRKKKRSTEKKDADRKRKRKGE